MQATGMGHPPRASVVAMPPDTPPTPQLAARPKQLRLLWRVGTPLVALLSGTLFVVSAESSEGTDLRPGRYTDLAEVVSAKAVRLKVLKLAPRNLIKKFRS
jgi:hypothetical protein